MKVDKNDAHFKLGKDQTNLPLKKTTPKKTTPNEIPHSKKISPKKIKNQTGVINKFIEFAKNQFTQQNVEKLTTNAKKLIINQGVNQISPFFNPAGFLFSTNYDKKIIVEIKNKNKLNYIIHALKNKLEFVNEKIKTTPKENQSKLLERQKNILSLINNYKETYQQTKNILKYLNEQKNLELGGRFTGNAAHVVNAFIPGTKVAVNLALTTGKIAMQEKSAQSLPSHLLLAKEEQKNIRNRTWMTVATQTAVVAFAVLSFPIVRQGLSSMGVPFL